MVLGEGGGVSVDGPLWVPGTIGEGLGSRARAEEEGARAGRVTLNSLSMGSLLCRRWDKSRRL